MRHFTAFSASRLALFAHLLLCSFVHADPQLTSWFTAGSTKYARIYTSTANRAAGISTTTWTGQTSPTYAGVHEINYSPNWVYIRNSGLAPYVMGPWNNPNLPKNQGTATGVYRFPRIPTIPTSKTLTGMGSIGFLVDGVSIYNTADGFSYSYARSMDASPIAGIGPGDGIWNRDAWPNEKISFDNALNHPQPSGQYHAHVTAIGVRYLLGDNVQYDESTKNYSENTSTAVFQHSPIIGWINDGLPLYGPYGYSDPMDTTSPVRRMISGYVLRNGTYGTDNLALSSRTSLPRWAQLAQNKTTLASNQFGPSVSTTYELGHFSEDYDYLGDHGYTQGSNSTANGYTILFDLNQYNARWCKTPEFPNGTWAYFTTITSSGTPWYPYNVGRWYMATPPASTGTPPTSGNFTTVTVMNADTPLIQYYKGATSTTETWSSTPVTISGSTVTLSWNAVEGGTYQVSTSTDLSNSTWTPLSGTVTPVGNSGEKTDTVNTSTTPKKLYKITRTGIATYDNVGY